MAVLAMDDGYYTLDEADQPVRVCGGSLGHRFALETMIKWAEWMQEHKQVEWTEVRESTPANEGIFVSTVFLGRNLPEAGMLFETMVLGGKYHSYQVRYKTKAGAVEGHAAVVRMVTDAKGDIENAIS